MVAEHKNAKINQQQTRKPEYEKKDSFLPTTQVLASGRPAGRVDAGLQRHG
jgi:hypothetical protein